jgi:hypothetical protein
VRGGVIEGAWVCDIAGVVSICSSGRGGEDWTRELVGDIGVVGLAGGASTGAMLSVDGRGVVAISKMNKVAESVWQVCQLAFIKWTEGGTLALVQRLFQENQWSR